MAVSVQQDRRGQGRPNKLVRLPLASRPAPRRQIESAAELLGHSIPDWVVALWSCNINLGMLAYQEAGQLGKYLVEVDRAAHAASAPRAIVFFAGDADLYPGTQRSSGRGRGTEFVKGELAGTVYGFEPSVGIKDSSPQLIEYRHKVTDPRATAPARRAGRVSGGVRARGEPGGRL